MSKAPVSTRAATLRATDPAGEGGGRRELTRRRLLDGAFRLLGQEQGRNVRIEEICVAASVSRGTFYNYFSSLDEMYAALSVELNHDFNDAVRDTMARMDDVAQRASAGLRYYLDRARQDPQWGWAMVHISAAGPLFGAETFASALATVEEGIALGEFDLADARIGRDLVLGIALSTMITQLREGMPASHSSTVALYALRSLGVPEARARAVIARPLPEPSRP